jgi:short-subunit dehydrogenase/catechol 2,3-dioxygenase-like lactoylglutathione lyase family enzyme
VAERCRAAGAEVATRRLDLRERPALRAWVARASAGLVIANGGTSGATAGSAEMVAVNLQSVVDTAEAALPAMRAAGGGRLALMSSLAAYRGMPSAPVYSATKAAVRFYGQALRARERSAGIVVSVICPGFVATPMTADNPFPMPLLMTPERAADRVLRGLGRGRAVIGFPWRSHLAARLLALLPAAVADRMLAGLPGKEVRPHATEDDMTEVRVRYIVDDVDAAIAFYAGSLGFAVDRHPAPGFAALSLANLRLLLNRPGAGGAGTAGGPGEVPAPGGWNRIQIEVADLAATVERLTGAGCRFRGGIVVGNGGSQALVEDPSGNLVELFQPR